MRNVNDYLSKFLKRTRHTVIEMREEMRKDLIAGITDQESFDFLDSQAEEVIRSIDQELSQLQEQGPGALHPLHFFGQN